MSAVVSVSACKVVEKHITDSTRLDSVWRITEEDSIQRVVACVHVFSSKCQTSFKTAKLTFYSLNITLLTFTDQVRRHQIRFGNTVVAYLPLFSHTESEQEEKFRPLSKRNLRTALLHTPHECIRTSLAPLSERAYGNLQCQTKCWTDGLPRFLISFLKKKICLDVNEAVKPDLLVIHVLSKKKLPLLTSFLNRNLDRTIVMIDACTTGSLTQN